MEFVNLTNYAAKHAVMMNGAGREVLLVAVKATFSLAAGAPGLAEEQDPVAAADEYSGEPDASSLVRAGEMPLFKPAADVVLAGCAYTAASRRSVTEVTFQVASVTKVVRVTGDRVWGGTFGAASSAPEPFDRMELSYERAFGGQDRTSKPPEAWADNPVGRGFRGRSSQRATAGEPLPNLEDPSRPMGGPDDRPPTCALGPVPPSWRPRTAYAGTYDERWRRDRMPFPPADFDPRYENTAALDQVLPGYLVGGEPVRITGVRPDGAGYQFSLPAFRPEIVVRIGDRRETPEVRCDTLVVDTEAQRLWLVARGVVDVQGKVSSLRWTKVQEGHRA
jgi:hypothetical protein